MYLSFSKWKTRVLRRSTLPPESFPKDLPHRKKIRLFHNSMFRTTFPHSLFPRGPSPSSHPFRDLRPLPVTRGRPAGQRPLLPRDSTQSEVREVDLLTRPTRRVDIYRHRDGVGGGGGSGVEGEGEGSPIENTLVVHTPSVSGEPTRLPVEVWSHVTLSVEDGVLRLGRVVTCPLGGPGLRWRTRGSDSEGVSPPVRVHLLGDCSWVRTTRDRQTDRDWGPHRNPRENGEVPGRHPPT